ncbi:MAG: hypothetical protein ACR2NL_08845 [Acidimicrobiia bacterium]
MSCSAVIVSGVTAVLLVAALAFAANGADGSPTTTSTTVASLAPAGSQLSPVDDHATDDINDDSVG